MNKKERTKYAIKKALEISEVYENISQQNCSKWDSLHHLNLVVELETEFDISLEPEEIAIMNDFNKILEVLESKGVY